MAQEQSLSSNQASPTSTWPDWLKQIVAVLLILALPLALYVMRPVLTPTLLTFAFAFILMYPIRLLQKWTKLSYRVSALLVYFIFFLVTLAGIIWFMASAVISLLDTLQSAIAFGEQIFALTQNPADNNVSQLLNKLFLHDSLKALSLVGTGVSLLSAPGEFFAAIIERLSAFTGFISDYGFMIILLLFFLLEWPRTKNIISNRIPSESRREYNILLKRTVTLAQNYLLGSLLIVLFYWVVTALLFAISGVPHPIVLGLIVAIPNFIPQGGGMVSALLVFIITLATGSESFAVNALLFAFIEMAIFMLISGVAYYFVDTKIYSKSVNTPVWVILIGIVVFGAIMGVVGLFIAAAAVAIIGEWLDFILKKLQGRPPYPEISKLSPAEQTL